MKNIGATVITKYCTGVIWHGLHGAQMTVVVNCALCNLFLGSVTHTHSHTLSVAQIKVRRQTTEIKANPKKENK